MSLCLDIIIDAVSSICNASPSMRQSAVDNKYHFEDTSRDKPTSPIMTSDQRCFHILSAMSTAVSAIFRAFDRT